MADDSTPDLDRPPVERATPPTTLVRFVNPALRLLLESPLHPLASRQLMLLHFRGRRSGQVYSLPVGRHDLDGQLLALTNSGWRVNFRDGTDCQVTVEGKQRRAYGLLQEEPREVSDVYARLLERVSVRNARRLGLQVNVERMPSRAELAEAVRSSGLSVVRLELT